jgi:hypothetical protein
VSEHREERRVVTAMFADRRLDSAWRAVGSRGEFGKTSANYADLEVGSGNG